LLGEKEAKRRFRGGERELRRESEGRGRERKRFFGNDDILTSPHAPKERYDS
jgi:hypothetical protein